MAITSASSQSMIAFTRTMPNGETIPNCSVAISKLDTESRFDHFKKLNGSKFCNHLRLKPQNGMMDLVFRIPYANTVQVEEPSHGMKQRLSS